MRLAAALAGIAMISVSNAQAQSMEPLSYTNAPIGLNFLVAGYGYQSGNVLVDPSLPLKNVHATADTPFLAYGRIIDFWGQSGSVGIVLPYARLSATADVFGQQSKVERNGLSDLSLRLSINVYGAAALSLRDFSDYHQNTIIGASFQVTAPSGYYMPSKLVNIGTNRWSFKSAIGVSGAVAPWTFEAATGVTFFTDNDDYFGGNVRHQDALLAVQAHAIYNFNRKMWAALDVTYYAGGRTSLNGSLDNDLQSNSRWGGTYAYTITAHDSVKLYFSSGVTARTGTDFRVYGIAWQYRWGAGLRP